MPLVNAVERLGVGTGQTINRADVDRVQQQLDQLAQPNKPDQIND